MLEELSQDVILDYPQSDKYRGDLFAVPGARHEIVHNPLCGDMIDLWLDARDGIVVDVKFCGSGCAISQASAALMAELIRGRRVADLPFENEEKVVAQRPARPANEQHRAEQPAQRAGSRQALPPGGAGAVEEDERRAAVGQSMGAAMKPRPFA